MLAHRRLPCRARDGGPRGIVVRVADGAATLVQLAAEGDEAYDALVATARGLAEHVLLLNLPEDAPARPALARVAGEPAIRQHEMLLEL